MSYLDEWARENLNPEYQEFFAEQAKIKEDCERIEQWHYRPEEAMSCTAKTCKNPACLLRSWMSPALPLSAGCGVRMAWKFLYDSYT